MAAPDANCRKGRRQGHLIQLQKSDHDEADGATQHGDSGRLSQAGIDLVEAINNGVKDQKR